MGLMTFQTAKYLSNFNLHELKTVILAASQSVGLSVIYSSAFINLPSMVKAVVFKTRLKMFCPKCAFLFTETIYFFPTQ